MKLRREFIFCVILASLMLFSTSANSADPAASYPSKPIEYVTHVGPADSMGMIGQLIVDIVHKEKVLPQPVFVTQKPGAGMAMAFAYMYEKRGDAHIVGGVPARLVIATPLRVKVPYNYKDFAPIANLCVEGSVIVVNPKSPYKTINDLINEARKRPNEITQSGLSLVSNEGLMGIAMQKIAGVRWKFVSFKTEAEAVSNVLGLNMDFTFTNPSTIIEHVRAGTLRVILVGTARRYEAFPDAPTIKEAGLGDPLMSYRGLMGPPEMPAYAVKTLEAAARKILDSGLFKKFFDQTLMQPEWMNTAEYGKFLDEQHPLIKQQLIDSGIIKP